MEFFCWENKIQERERNAWNERNARLYISQAFDLRSIDGATRDYKARAFEIGRSESA